MNISDWALIAATVSRPILAVQAQKWVERATESLRHRYAGLGVRRCSKRETQLRKPVSVTYRTGLRYAETEIGKWRAETGAAKPPDSEPKVREFASQRLGPARILRECRQFSHRQKSHGGDRTGWLGWEDSNSQMSLPKLAFEVWPEATVRCDPPARTL